MFVKLRVSLIVKGNDLITACKLLCNYLEQAARGERVAPLF